VLTLRDIQTQVVNALLNGAIEDIAYLVAHSRFGPTAGLGVYRNNTTEGFRKALAMEFPVIERLVGAQYFSQLSLRYQQHQPSSSGDLRHIGANFPRFLAQEFASSKLDYLGDVAELEWTIESTSIAADEYAVAIEELRRASPERYPDLRLTRRKSTALVGSIYPIVTIWQTNQSSDLPYETIDLAQGGQHALVRRSQRGMEILVLSAPEFEFLRILDASCPLIAALDAALSVDADFDLGASLRRFFELGLFSRIYIPQLTESLS
jgi:uncharacterized protein